MKHKVKLKPIQDIGNRFVIWARVSSEKQEEGHSLETQVKNNTEYCAKKNLDVIKSYVITESASKVDRPKFYEMLDFINAQKGTIHLVATTTDRLHRGIEAFAILNSLKSAGKIIIHFSRENIIYDKTSDGIKYHLDAVLANSETAKLSKRVTCAFDKKREEGTILGPAPIGYLNMPRSASQKRAVVELDPERAYIVKRIFEEYATGLCSMNEVRVNATNRGLRTVKGNKKLGKSQIEKILSNPFYYGYMVSKGNIYEHHYDRLITKALFDECQDVRFGRDLTSKNRQI